MCLFYRLYLDLVEVTEFPEEHQHLLVELDLFSGVGQVGRGQGVGQQTRKTLQNKVIVLWTYTHKQTHTQFAYPTCNEIFPPNYLMQK